MNSKNLLIKRKKSAYKMDATSDRYRECPNDNVKFMAEHRSEIFCTARCADEFHNQKKKQEAEKNMLNEIYAALKTTKPEQIRQSEESAIAPVESSVAEPKNVPLTSLLIVNIFLIGQRLGNSQSLIIYKNYLPSKGLIYDLYDNKYQMPGTELFVLTYGPYAIAWAYENKIILTYKKNLRWIQ